MICLKMKFNRKKGFVFSLDALLAVIIVTIVFLFTINYFSQTHEKIYYIYSAKEANDALAVLDYKGILDAADEGEIMQEIAELLPSSEAKLNITISDIKLENKITTTFGDIEKNFVISGKRFFILTNETVNGVNGFGVVKYLVWKK